MSTISHQGFVVGDGNHPGVCSAPTHSDSRPRDFVGRAPGMDRCHACGYGESMAEAEDDFGPLTRHLDAAGVRWSVDQTGGMVMCLRIDLPAILGSWAIRWIWVSDLDELLAEGELSVGVYGGDEDGEPVGNTRTFRFLDYDDDGEPDINDTVWQAFAHWIIAITKEHR